MKFLKFLFVIFVFVQSTMVVFAGDSNSINFTPYMDGLQEVIKKNWNGPAREHNYSVVVLFKIEKSGAITSCRIFKSSGDKLVDNSAMAAVAKTKTYKPLPADFKGNSLEIQFTFERNKLRDENDINSGSCYLLSTDESENFYVSISQENKKIYDGYIKYIDKFLSVYLPSKRYSRRQTVDVSFTIKEDGKTKNVEIQRFSDNQPYNELVKSFIETVNFLPVPKDLGVKELKVKYRIHSGII